MARSVGAELKKTWKAAERAALGEVGFRRINTEEYTIPLDDANTWLGSIVLPKLNTRGSDEAQQAYPVFGLAHVPTEELIGQLRGTKAGDGPTFTIHADTYDLIPAELQRDFQVINAVSSSDVTLAVEATLRMVMEWCLPWMRRNMDLEVLRKHFASYMDRGNREAHRLERLAVINYRLGNLDQSSAAVERYRTTCCATGIEKIDAPSLRFVAEMNTLLLRTR